MEWDLYQIETDKVCNIGEKLQNGVQNYSKGMKETKERDDFLLFL